MTQKSVKQFILSSLFILTCFCFTACGSTKNGNNADETPGVNNETGNTTNDMNNTGTNDSTNGSMNNDSTGVGETLMEGAENLVEDITNIDFTDYKSSHDYLLDKIAGNEGNDSGRYVVREESKEAVSYDPLDSTKKGYRYEVYDTTSDSDDKYGVFYVDHETGTIYRENDKTDKIEEYKGH